jgi:hypothetical protein
MPPTICFAIWHWSLPLSQRKGLTSPWGITLVSSSWSVAIGWPPSHRHTCPPPMPRADRNRSPRFPIGQSYPPALSRCSHDFSRRPAAARRPPPTGHPPFLAPPSPCIPLHYSQLPLHHPSRWPSSGLSHHRNMFAAAPHPRPDDRVTKKIGCRLFAVTTRACVGGRVRAQDALGEGNMP